MGIHLLGEIGKRMASLLWVVDLMMKLMLRFVRVAGSTGGPRRGQGSRPDGNARLAPSKRDRMHGTVFREPRAPDSKLSCTDFEPKDGDGGRYFFWIHTGTTH